MLSITITFALSLVAALALTPLVRRLAPHIGGMDVAGENQRKIHVESIPRIGGIAIVIAFYIPLLGLVLTNSGVGYWFTRDPSLAYGLLLGGLPILALGIYDDIVGANVVQKVAVQTTVAVTLYFLGFQIEAISTPFGRLELGIAALPVSILWMVGLINALNLIDGLDGLASGVAFFAAVTTFSIAFVNDNVLMMLFMAALGGAVIGFLAYNFNPATIFMGDTGSMFLGYVIGVTALQTNTKGSATVALLTPVVALGLPIVDTTLAMARRGLAGKPLFQGDREHIHHRLMARGMSHRRAVVTLYAVCICLGGMSLLHSYVHGAQSGILLACMAVVMIVALRYLGYFKRARNQLREAASLDEMWNALLEHTETLGVSQLCFTPPIQGARFPTGKVWRQEPLSDTSPFIEKRTVGARGASLEFVWLDGRETLDARCHAAVESIIGDVEAALSRIPHG